MATCMQIISLIIVFCKFKLYCYCMHCWRSVTWANHSLLQIMLRSVFSTVHTAVCLSCHKHIWTKPRVCSSCMHYSTWKKTLYRYPTRTVALCFQSVKLINFAMSVELLYTCVKESTKLQASFSLCFYQLMVSLTEKNNTHTCIHTHMHWPLKPAIFQ